MGCGRGSAGRGGRGRDVVERGGCGRGGVGAGNRGRERCGCDSAGHGKPWGMGNRGCVAQAARGGQESRFRKVPSGSCAQVQLGPRPV